MQLIGSQAQKSLPSTSTLRMPISPGIPADDISSLMLSRSIKAANAWRLYRQQRELFLTEDIHSLLPSMIRPPQLHPCRRNLVFDSWYPVHQIQQIIFRALKCLPPGSSVAGCRLRQAGKKLGICRHPVIPALPLLFAAG